MLLAGVSKCVWSGSVQHIFMGKGGGYGGLAVELAVPDLRLVACLT
jgi:hypothetical protein